MFVFRDTSEEVRLCLGTSVLRLSAQLSVGFLHDFEDVGVAFQPYWVAKQRSREPVPED